MKLITEKSIIHCDHDGQVRNLPSQHWLTVESVPVLVDHDPEGRTITACPNAGPTMKPCTTTLVVRRGYSNWIRVDGRRIVLDHLDGLTDGTVPGTVHYVVRDPAQPFVDADR